MKFTKLISTVVGVIAIAMASPSHAELYRVTSIAPGMLLRQPRVKSIFSLILEPLTG